MKKLKFTIKHPKDVRITSFQIHTTLLNRSQIYAFLKETSPDILIEGEIEVITYRPSVLLSINAVGRPNLLVTYNVEYNGKKIMEKDGEFVIGAVTGRGGETHQITL